MPIDTATIGRLVDAARARGESALVGADALAVAAALGVRCPRTRTIAGAADVRESALAGFGDRVVVKAVSPDILHKSDLGAVAAVPNEVAAVRGAIEEMAERLGAYPLAGFLLSEFVAYDGSLGGELLVGVRWTDEFGPLVTVGPGGVTAEFVARNLRDDRNLAVMSPLLHGPRTTADCLRDAAVVELATTRLRGRAPRIAIERVVEVVDAFMTVARTLVPTEIAELEINPLVEHGGRLVALDARVLLGHPFTVPLPRPIAKLRHLLEPERIAIVGVSGQSNPGRIILRNLLREGFDPDRITVVKPGVEQVDGCRAVASVAGLPAPVDLLVLSVGAAAAATIAADVIATRKAESLIVIPGGFEEHADGGGRAASVRSALETARRSAWRGPLINGPNCVGIRSRPGRYDTMFIPPDWLPPDAGPAAPVAILAQSGALALSILAKLPGVNPQYCITVGNQMDLTLGDYLTYLKDDPAIDLFAVYVEGFRPIDGATFMQVASEIVASGRTVILYRAGRTEAGRRASATHTASLTGDYTVTRALAREAGVIVADTLDDFEDLIKLFSMLRGRRVAGRQLGAVSNAGFECVALADRVGAFQLAGFSDRTTERLQTALKLSRIDGLVDVHNPLDLTPMLGDVAYGEVARAVLEDEHVDVAVIGCVPMTSTLDTVPAGRAGFGADSIVTGLVRLKEQTAKAWIAVVDAGALYDPMVSALEAGGIATFRTADRALRLFEVFCEERLRLAVASRLEQSVDVFELIERPD